MRAFFIGLDHLQPFLQIAGVTRAGGGAGTGVNEADGTGYTYGVNTGSGGGRSTSGNSGIVIIRYANTFADLQSISVGLTYSLTTTGGYKIYSFTAGTGTVGW